MLAQPYIPLAERINHGASVLNHETLDDRHIHSICLYGTPRSGKTTLLERTIRRLSSQLRIGVIVGNIWADRDAERLRRVCDRVRGIENVDLDAELLREALTEFDLTGVDVLFIERNAAVPPYPLDLGQSASVAVFSLTDGAQRVQSHAERIACADLLLLTKGDLLVQGALDRAAIVATLRSSNTVAPLIETSAARGAGFDRWCQWILDRVHSRRASEHLSADPVYHNYYFG